VHELQTLTTDRVHHDHLDFTPLGIWVLLNTNLHSNRIEHADFHILPIGGGDSNRIILRIEGMSFFLEGN
jgi:hypothetical protein